MPIFSTSLSFLPKIVKTVINVVGIGIVALSLKCLLKEVHSFVIGQLNCKVCDGGVSFVKR